MILQIPSTKESPTKTSNNPFVFCFLTKAKAKDTFIRTSSIDRVKCQSIKDPIPSFMESL